MRAADSTAAKERSVRMRSAGLPAGGGRGSFAAKVGLVAGLAVLATGGGLTSAGAQVRSSSSSFELGSADPLAHSSAKKVGSRVKIVGLTDSVTGGVKSRKRQCEKRRLASLIHVTLAGLAEIDRERTTKKGRFSLDGAVPGQTYFVGVGRKTVTKFRLGKRPKKLICPQTESDRFVP
jgi:hypothetical protein